MTSSTPTTIRLDMPIDITVTPGSTAHIRNHHKNEKKKPWSPNSYVAQCFLSGWSFRCCYSPWLLHRIKGHPETVCSRSISPCCHDVVFYWSIAQGKLTVYKFSTQAISRYITQNKGILCFNRWHHYILCDPSIRKVWVVKGGRLGGHNVRSSRGTALSYAGSAHRVSNQTVSNIFRKLVWLPAEHHRAGLPVHLQTW